MPNTVLPNWTDPNNRGELHTISNRLHVTELFTVLKSFKIIFSSLQNSSNAKSFVMDPCLFHKTINMIIYSLAPFCKQMVKQV